MRDSLGARAGRIMASCQCPTCVDRRAKSAEIQEQINGLNSRLSELQMQFRRNERINPCPGFIYRSKP